MDKQSEVSYFINFRLNCKLSLIWRSCHLWFFRWIFKEIKL